MSKEENKALVRRALRDVFNGKNLEAYGQYYSEDYTLEATTWFLRSFPDATVACDEQYADGDMVVSHISGRGTHLGDFMGVPATGKQIEFSYVAFDRVVDGKIAEHRGFANWLDYLKQLGAEVAVPGT